MKFMRRVFVVAAVMVAVVAARGVAAERDILKTTLENGLTVILEEDHSAPVVAIQMWVRVGGADERDEEAGIAHVFEHMLFKGTARRKVGDIAKEVEAAGGAINAYTSYDNTVYHLVVASRYFSTGLDIISDAIRHSAFDPVELEKELKVVLEEIRMNEDRPERRLYMSVLRNAYTRHPYGRPVIGSRETVLSFTRAQILEFFARWYVPNNMTLVVVGDFDKEAALDEVKRAFADARPGPDPHRPRPEEPEQRLVRGEVIAAPVAETRLALAFHIPELSHPDTYAVDVLSGVLGQGATSRLYRRLKINDELVHSISSYAMTPKEPGLFFITASLESKNLERTIWAVIEETERLAAEGPSPDELARVKLNLESDFIYSRETMEGKASQLGYYETISGDLAFERRYIEGIRAVTADDVKKAAATYLDVQKMTLSALVPDAEAADIRHEHLVETARSAAYEARMAFSGEVEADEIRKITLENGITLIVKEVHTNPTVAFYLTFPGGLRFETPENNGISAFAASMLTRGTATWSRRALAREIESMAGGLGGFSGRNSIGLSGKFLSRFFDRAFELAADMVKNASFPADEVEKLRADILADIKRQKDYLPGYTFKLLYRELYREHPYGMPRTGVEETVSKITRDELIAFYTRHFVPEKMVISVVGDVNASHVIEKVKELYGGLERRAVALKEPAPERRPMGIRRTGEIREAAQTNIGIGFLGTTIRDDDRFALEVLTEILSSQGGRLFVELRDKRSLAYSVSAFSRPGVEPGMIGVYIGCAPEKKDAAIEGILEQLRKVTAEKVSPEELRRAKSALIGAFEVGLQEVSSQASELANDELFGLGYDFYKRYPARIEAVTADDVLRAARKYLTLDAYTISVVGPNGYGDGEEEGEKKQEESKKTHRL
ncbi:MAG TPA: insulinase family protein [Deltaproteobacteria bacterium]|nr:insulinase family protein [Deltaproteobacteria bacterium]